MLRTCKFDFRRTLRLDPAELVLQDVDRLTTVLAQQIGCLKFEKKYAPIIKQEMKYDLFAATNITDN